jgi:hypothetical protein
MAYVIHYWERFLLKLQSRRISATMSEKVVLPKFRVPGRGPHWMVMALWGVAGLVVIQVAVFAIIAWNHQSAPAAPPQVASSAPASAPVVAAPAVTAAPVASRPTTMTGGMPAPHALPVGSARHHRVRQHGSAGRSDKTLARAGVGKSPESSKNDALDDLLRKFK